jgi:hypothetical protein
MRYQSLKRVSLVLAMSVVIGASSHAATCTAPWRSVEASGCEFIKRDVGRSFAYMRAGYIPENPQQEFRGNVVYFEGLGDSMLNHMPLLNALSDAGFRVIAFDYLGQGGSSGSMNDTHVEEIPKVGALLLYRYGRDVFSTRKIFLGWSTGGLAAYLGAALGLADTVVLLNPGLALRVHIGEGIFSTITLRTLTHEPYRTDGTDPHVEEIKPTSPLKVPLFTADLFATAFYAQELPISSHVKGLVMLSGRNDRYFYPAQTQKVLEKQAPHFEIRHFPEAFHELDNESEPVSLWVRQGIVDFLLKK